MNSFLKLKHYRYLFKKNCGDLFKYKNHLELFSTQSTTTAIRNHVPFIYSYHQIREFAKRAQGKMSKGGKAKSMQLTKEEMEEVIDVDDYQQQLNDVVDKLKKEYINHLSFHSAAGNIEKVIVKIDDEEYPLNELANIHKKSPTLIAINMSDFPEGLKPAIQAIIDSGSNFNPQQDGTMIYVNVPKMTREHRENLAKNARTLYIKAKDEVRSIQNSFLKVAKGKTNLSEDLTFNASNQIMMMAEQCSTDLEKVLKTKQKELLGDG